MSVRNGGFAHRNTRCGLRARRVTGTGTEECTFEVKTVERHTPAEPQHMKNGRLQSLVRVGLSFLLFHVLSSDAMHLPELWSERSPESASCEKRWYRPSQHALWERSSKYQRRWNRTHHPIETDCTVSVLRVENGLFVMLLMEGGSICWQERGPRVVSRQDSTHSKGRPWTFTALRKRRTRTAIC